MEVGEGAGEESEDRTVGGEEGLCAERTLDDGWEWLISHGGGMGEECKEAQKETDEQDEEGGCSGTII